MDNKYFSQRPELKPIIYVYEIPDAENRKGLLKIGYTTRNAKGRIKEQLGWENYLNELKVDRGLRYKLKRTVEMVGHMIRGKKWE